jgi:predicted SnoaL-like aldol condensation-catalyzing enzyme
MPGKVNNMNRKQIASEFLRLASGEGVQEAYSKYVHPGFIHHNAYFKGDRESLLEAMEENAQQFPDKKYETLRSLEEGDLVAVHGRVKGVFNSEWSIIHIFRFHENKIIEAWETSQEVIKDSPNENGLF